ncbi:MAG: PLP-dependent transferase [Roseburia sp.]|nr:PLP-dependent transferase [Roseburia sp.]
MKKETQCIHEGYYPKNGESRVVPITMSTAFRYDTTEQVGDLFDLKDNGWFYTRLGNPTIAVPEAKLAALEGGVGAMMTSSGQSASMLSVLNLASAGDSIVSATAIYGGTFNLFDVTLRKLGIDFIFADFRDFDAVEKAIKPNTKALFCETLANPALQITDIERIAQIAHRHGIPLIMDSTFTTPILCRPFEFGADIVVHSSTKYLDGHDVAVGGFIVDSGKFDWTNGNFPAFTTPDDSYHGVVYTRDFGAAAYITKARTQLMRDMGTQASPFNAFLTNLGMETLSVRMERHCENALKVARFLAGDGHVKSITYPMLENNSEYEKCIKYMGGKGSGVISFELESREKCVKFMNSLKLVSLLVHVADLRTCALHPASSTHRQLSDAALRASGISPSLIRLSVGLENADDIIDDIKNALKKI